MSKEKCTKELVAKATELVSSGLRNKDVIEYLGISDSAFYGWLKNPRTENQVALAESLQKARIDRKQRYLNTISNAAEDGDWKAAAWYMERNFPLDYSLSNARFRKVLEEHEREHPRPTIDTASLVPPAYWDVWRDIMAAGHGTYEGTGGRGSLKSTILGGIAPVMLMLRDPKLCGVAFRQVQGTIRDSIFATIISAIKRLGVEAEFEYTYQPMEIRRRETGQVILFRGLDDPEKAKSLQLKDPDQYIGFAIWEEFNQFKGMRQVRKAEQSVKRGGAPHFWTFRMWNTHPDEEHWSNEHWRESVEDPDTYAIRVNYNEVPAEWLGEAFIADALKLKAANEEAYRNEYLGECSKLTGRVFANVEDFQCDQQAVNGFKWVKNGIDWGYMQDPFVFLRVAYDRKMGDLYIFDELYNTETLDQPNIDEVKRRLAERDSDGRPKLTAEGRLLFKKSKPCNEIRADAAAPKDIATWKEGGVWIMGASKRVPVDDGIRWLQKRAHIYIDRRRCPLAWAEFTRYRALEDEEGHFKGFPDQDNHTIDAVRYAVFDLIADRTIV